MTIALTIAGSDPSGGAGLQADLKTFHHFQVYGTSVVSLLTVQNTQSVLDVRIMDVDLVLAQLDAVLSDVPPSAAKTGALGSARLIEAIADRAQRFAFPLVVDPVMVSKHGDRLIDDDTIDSIRRRLLPTATWVTPNRHEAQVITQSKIDDVASMEQAAKQIADMGPDNVWIKGGRLGDESLDVVRIGSETRHLRGPWIDTQDTHGTGCVLSAALTANLALGVDAWQAAETAKAFLTRALRPHPKIGRGIGPVNFFPPND
ncbi:Hydroxymethylpyrimidine/phosphomethylpyrimidine kinase [Rubripirellula lacrimiformis]|uniref:hydroxymethylpyrimidine kinase n=1 Tax=Rubripirellula lacrimiformis TaxID=1930273 RepID=A0A517N9U5_9BACT|nr:bifunctional hydroxymethylpyrimidine kinase/phosphomethylpyrimidine kinase [Rubripirellula lacrimiformis]QDT03900.1 Hydroxymethylpyrimidine/phosphomethylpyrimidine kinase [Rubripirellula lacrimiformis]